MTGEGSGWQERAQDDKRGLRMTGETLHSDNTCYVRMRVVIYEFKVFVSEVKDALDLRVDLHLRKLARLTREL
jgi:hypothetical protein